MRRRLALVLASFVVAGSLAGAPPDKAPVRRLGKTVVQWKDGAVQVVMSYRWANGVFEKERWLFFETAVMSAASKPAVVNREDVSLRLPDGTIVQMPSQKTMAEDNKDILRQVNMAKASREPVTGYFVGAEREVRLGFFAVPGMDIVVPEVTVSFRTVAIGDLFFTTPTGLWKPGAYALLIKNKDLAVELPFDLPAGELKKKGDATVPW